LLFDSYLYQSLVHIHRLRACGLFRRFRGLALNRYNTVAFDDASKIYTMKPNIKDNAKATTQKSDLQENTFRGYSVKKPETDLDEPLSKTQLKAEADALQDLGVKLIALPKDKLAKLNLPERLDDAIREAKRLTANGAIRRQKQHIGSLMRDIETAEIIDQLHRWDGKHTAENAHFHMLERWRDRMIASPEVVAEWMKLHPNTDSQQLRTLIRNVQRELATSKPPKSSRELFKLIREVTEADTTSTGDSSTDDLLDEQKQD